MSRQSLLNHFLITDNIKTFRQSFKVFNSTDTITGNIVYPVVLQFKIIYYILYTGRSRFISGFNSCSFRIDFTCQPYISRTCSNVNINASFFHIKCIRLFIKIRQLFVLQWHCDSFRFTGLQFYTCKSDKLFKRTFYT